MEKENKEVLKNIANHMLEVAKVIEEETKCTHADAVNMAMAIFLNGRQTECHNNLMGLIIQIANGDEREAGRILTPPSN